MKLSLILLLFFFANTRSFAQNDYGLNNTAESIKKSRVKSLAIYYFKKENDSILTTISTFDSLGDLVSRKGFSSDGNVSSSDTFIYDTNHYLVKHVGYSGNKIVYESIFINNDNGKVLKQIMTSDSFHYESRSNYDKNGHLETIVWYDNKADTTVSDYTYNKRGWIKKYISIDNKKDTTARYHSYNSSGKLVKEVIIDSRSRSFAKLKYNGNGEMYEAITTTISDKETTINKVTYSYYLNGLAYQRIFYKGKNPINLERSYYTYY